MIPEELYKQLRKHYSQWYFSTYIPLMLKEGIIDSNWKSDLNQLKIVEELLSAIWLDVSHVNKKTKFYDALNWRRHAINRLKMNKKE